MNRYEKILDMLGRILIGFVMIVVCGGGFVVGVPLLICLETGPIGIIIGLISIPLGGFLMMQGINTAILNQPYRLTGIVKEGQSTIEAVKTLKYTKLSMWFCFFGTIIYLGIAIFSFIYAFSPNGENKIIMIVVGAISLILSIICFLMAGKRKIDVKHHINIEE